MHNISKYVNSSCRTCTYSIKCPTFVKGTADKACEDCPNCDTTDGKHSILNCRCFKTAPDANICPYYKEYKDGKDN